MLYCKTDAFLPCDSSSYCILFARLKGIRCKQILNLFLPLHITLSKVICFPCFLLTKYESCQSNLNMNWFYDNRDELTLHGNYYYKIGADKEM